MRYMAPEQLEGGEADARTDIFAFGTILYEIIQGKKAFDGQESAESGGRHHDERAGCRWRAFSPRLRRRSSASSSAVWRRTRM
jgi:serine/threonine protein kinase